MENVHVKKKILIATPQHTDHLLLQYVQSAFKIMNDKSVYDVNVYFKRGSLVNRCRNELVGYFLESPYDYIFFIDSDIINFENEFVTIVNQYMEMEKDNPNIMLGAIYPIKHFNFDYVNNLADMKDKEWEQIMLNYNVNIHHLGSNNHEVIKEADNNNGLVKANEIAGGFMMFSKKVLIDIINKHPERKYSAFINEHLAPKNNLYNLFHSYVHPQSRFYLSEDYGFCNLFRENGGTIYANIKLPLTHYGEHAFRGSLYNTLSLRDPKKTHARWSLQANNEVIV